MDGFDPLFVPPSVSPSAPLLALPFVLFFVPPFVLLVGPSFVSFFASLFVSLFVLFPVSFFGLFFASSFGLSLRFVYFVWACWVGGSWDAPFLSAFCGWRGFVFFCVFMPWWWWCGGVSLIGAMSVDG